MKGHSLLIPRKAHSILAGLKKIEGKITVLSLNYRDVAEMVVKGALPKCA